jgi:hypothetical protein
MAVMGESMARAEDPSKASSRPAWWVIDGPTTVYVRRFLDLAAARGIPVFWLLPPTSPAYQARAERNGRDARYAAFVREMQAGYPNVVVVDGRRAGYRREMFADLTHLNRDGASTFSDAVASLIAPHLARSNGPTPAPVPRWLALPPCRVRPDERIPLEDLEQSMTALRASADRSRR